MRVFLVIISIIVVLVGIYFLQSYVERNAHENHEKLQKEVIQGVNSYYINKPDLAFDLSPKLQEISGLTYMPELDQLVAIEDENGLLYFLSKDNGEIINTTKFGKDDDYEGIAYADSNLFVLSSNGNLFEYRNKDDVIKYKTDLKNSFDFEGLVFFPTRNELLLASKESGPDTKSYLRKIFSFDLQSREVRSDPMTTLDCRKVPEHLPPARKTPTFSPSAIGIDKGENLFVLSSVARALIVTDSSGRITSGAKLDPTLHLQPEGIVIDDQGILYIANEGRGATPRLFVFKPKT